MSKQRLDLLISLVAVFVFLILCCNSLEAQGLYYDELHQATASFAYVGRAPFQFANLTFHNIPIMNMNYSGAIKTALYGLYMRVFDQTFSVISWRMLGILIVSVALMLYGIIVSKTISAVGLVSFCFFMLTDITVILTTRHDWGPTAIALSLRLIMVAIWMRGEFSREIKASNTFLIVFLLGLSLFEKLNAIVLIIPFILMIFLNPERRNKSHFLAFILGGITGACPLIMANLLSFFKGRELISFQFDSVQKIYSVNSFVSYLKEYLSLGAGHIVQSFILGLNSNSYGLVELITFPFILLFIILFIYHYRLIYDRFRIVGILILCYIVILIQLYFLPQNTWIHHWILGTPFQYTAIALLLSGLEENKTAIKNVSYRNVVMILLVILSLSRVCGLVAVEKSLSRGDTSSAWDKSFTQIGEFAASKSNNAIFVAADWGVANQLICFTNGENGSVLVPYWSDTGIADALHEIKNSRKTELYIIFTVPPHFVTAGKRQAELDEIHQSLFPEWQLQQVEEKVARLSSLYVVKYQKTTKYP